MARFKLINLTVRSIERGQNRGKQFISGGLLNLLDQASEPQTILMFNENQVVLFKQYIPKSRGGDGPEDVVLPPELSEVRGHFVTWQPPKACSPFIKYYVQDNPASGIKSGEPVKDRRTGKVRLYESVRVFCRYYIDPDFPGQVSYNKGESPEEKGQAYFNSFCSSYNDYLDSQGISREPITSSDDDDIMGNEDNEKPKEVDGKRIIGYDLNKQPIYG